MNLFQQLAEFTHEEWIRWMTYLFANCEGHKNGDIVIPKSALNRWKNQMHSKHEDLLKSEQYSNELEAQKILDLINKEHKIIKIKELQNWINVLDSIDHFTSQIVYIKEELNKKINNF